MDASNAWAEIQNLASLLKEAQIKKNANNLPERHCVDLINILCECNYISLIHTIDGKEYLTKEHLLKEISDLVKNHGGRISFLKLHQIINVDYSVIEKYTKESIIGKNGWQLLNDDIITESYINSIIQETQDILDQKGIVLYENICEKFSIPMEFMKKIFNYHEGQLFKGAPSTIEGGSFVSSQYVMRIEASLRGCLLAYTLPVLVQHIAKRLGNTEEYLATSITKLINENKIWGTVRGNIFFPGDTLNLLIKFMEEELSQKQYFNHSILCEYGINEPISLIKHLFKESNESKIHHLYSVSISSKLINEMSAKISHIINTSEFLFLNQNFFPNGIIKADEILIFDLCLKNLKLPLDFLASGLIHFDDEEVLFPTKIVTQFQEIMLKNSQERTKNLLIQDEKFRNELQQLKISIKKDNFEQNDSSRKRKDWKSKQSNTNNNLANFIRRFFTEKSFMGLFKEQYTEINSEIISKIIDLAHADFCKNFQSSIFTLLDEYYSSLQNNDTEPLSTDTENPPKQPKPETTDLKKFESTFIHIFNLILLYDSGASKIDDSEFSIDIFQYLLNSFGLEVYDLLLKIYICHNMKGLNLSPQQSSLCSTIESLDAKQRESLLNLISDNSEKHMLKQLFESIRLKEKSKFFDTIAYICCKNICNIPIKTTLNSSTFKITKKIHLEKMLTQFIDFNQLITPSVEDYAKIYNACLSVFVTHHSGNCVIFPGKRVSFILNYLETFPEFAFKDLCIEIKTQITLFLKNKQMKDHIEREDARVEDIKELVSSAIQILNALLK